MAGMRKLNSVGEPRQILIAIINFACSFPRISVLALVIDTGHLLDGMASLVIIVKLEILAAFV